MQKSIACWSMKFLTRPLQTGNIMNEKLSISELFHSTESLKALSLARLDDLIREYPYASVLHLLKARKKKLEGTLSDAELQRAAMYAPDRNRLHDWLELDLSPFDTGETPDHAAGYSDLVPPETTAAEIHSSSPTLPEHSDVASPEVERSQRQGAEDEQAGSVQPPTSVPQAELSHTDTPVPDTAESDVHENDEPEFNKPELGEPEIAALLSDEQDVQGAEPAGVHVLLDDFGNASDPGMDESVAPDGDSDRRQPEAFIDDSSKSGVVGQDVSASFELDGEPPSPDEDDQPDIPEELPAKESRTEIERRPETEISPGVPPEHTPISPRTPEIPPREPNSVIPGDAAAEDSSWSFIAWLASQRSARTNSQREEEHWQELSADTQINPLGLQPGSRNDAGETKRRHKAAGMADPETSKKVKSKKKDTDTRKLERKKKKKKRKKDKKKPLKKLIEKSIVQDFNIASEPLADLLAKQGHHQQATEMYERLGLIFPEKSAYFAQKIKKLKKN